MFYVALNEDAEILSNKCGFKITKLNETVTKCGFPNTRLDFYLSLFKKNSIDFEIIDYVYGKINNISNYLENEKIKSIVNEIISVDFDNITFKESYKKLENIANTLNNINIE